MDALAHGDDFADIILAEKESRAGIAREETFYLAGLIDLANGKRSTVESDKFIGVGQLKTCEGSLGTFETTVEEGQDHAVGAKNLAEAVEECGDEFRRKK